MRLTLMASCAALLLVGQQGWAQEPQSTPTTKIGQFVSRNSRLLSYEVAPLGRLDGLQGTSVELETLLITDVQTKEIIKGLRVNISRTFPTDRSTSVWCDMDEVVDLGAALDYMLTAIQKPTEPTPYAGAGKIQLATYRTLSYQTRDGLRVTVAPPTTSGPSVTGKWVVRITDLNPESLTALIGLPELTRMRAALDAALMSLRQ